MLCVQLEVFSRTLSHVKGAIGGLIHEMVILIQGLASWKVVMALGCPVAGVEGFCSYLVSVPLP